MKVAAPTIAAVEPQIEKAGKSHFAVISDLVKARLTALVVLTTLVGFYAGAARGVDYLLMFHAVCGTALVACGAAALNQLLEREHDGRMARTEDRPLPSGRMSPDAVLLIGGACSAGGLIYLAFAVNLLTAVLGAVTLISYLFVYTPLKRITSFNTIVGAIPGAIPPLMGWTAARDSIDIGGWALFAILFFWQLPHFYAIAWMYREDYEKGGFVMLPSVDPSGERTGRQAFSHTLGLLPVSLAPAVVGIAGVTYFFGAFILGVVFAWSAFKFSRALDRPAARRLFFVSIIYLPLLLGLLVFDKLR